MGEEETMYDSRLKNPQTDLLVQALLSLKDEEECYRFMEDLLTMREIRDLSQRLEVAHLLKQGHVYNDIVSETGASTATISRVNRSLNYGSDGYSIVFDRMKKDE